MQRQGKPVLSLEGEAHLWLTRVPTEIRPSDTSAWWNLLSDEEKERHGTFLFEEGKLQYLTAWALARTSLSRYADIAPQDWRFSRGKHGRPEIAPLDDAAAVPPPLRFNLSHSSGLVVCLVTLEVDVGVDVENTQRDLDMTRLADRFFSPEEANDVRALAGADQRERFFSYWTLKEAYLKARGRGLSIPLRQVSFRIAPGATLGVRFDAELRDHESNWQIVVCRPLRSHLLAAAIRRGRCPTGRRDLSIVARHVVPLVEETTLEALPVVASTQG